MKTVLKLLAATATLATAAPALAQMMQVSTHMGEMAAEASADGALVANEGETLRFEPYQMIDEMFFRDDVVFLMRHGPTDWNKLDIKKRRSDRLRQPAGDDATRASRGCGIWAC